MFLRDVFAKHWSIQLLQFPAVNSTQSKGRFIFWCALVKFWFQDKLRYHEVLWPACAKADKLQIWGIHFLSHKPSLAPSSSAAAGDQWAIQHGPRRRSETTVVCSWRCQCRMAHPRQMIGLHGVQGHFSVEHVMVFLEGSAIAPCLPLSW